MNLFQFSILLSLPATLLLGILVFLGSGSRKTNQAFFLLTAVMAAWLVFMGIAALSSIASQAAFWIRQTSAAAAFLPPAVNLLRLTLLYGGESWPALLRRASPWWLLAAVMVAVCNSPWFLTEARLPATSMDITEPVYGVIFPVYLGYMLASLAVMVRRFIRDLRAAVGIRRTEIQFMLLASCSAFFLGMTVFIAANFTGRHEILQVLPLFTAAFNGVTAYGLATRRILDAPHVVRRLLAFLLMLLYLSLIYFAVWTAMNWGMRHILVTELPLAHLAAALAVALCMPPLRWRTNRFIDRVFGHSADIDYADAMKSAGRIVNTGKSIPDMIERFGVLARDALQAESLRVYLATSSGFDRAYAWPPDLPCKRLPAGDPLVEALRDPAAPNPLVYDFIPRMRPLPVLARAGASMLRRGAAALAEIRARGAPAGIMLLGPRTGARVYDLGAQTTLSGLCEQMAVALENARLIEQIRRADRLASLGTLSAGMAHEIKNPLVTVKTFAQLLPERYDDPDFRENFSELVGHEIERIDAIVNQLLHFARPARPAPRPVGLHGVVSDTMRLVGEQLKRKSVECQPRLRAPRDIIMGDPMLLEQALVNILLNAAEAMDGTGGTITMTSRTAAPGFDGDYAGEGPPPERICLSIADSGPGIASERLSRVFDPFFTTKPQGTGLGLSIAHRIVQEHGGTIDVESAEGRGTVFHIAFPLYAGGESAS